MLIVKLSSIGDVVHTLPAAALLRESLPDANISWLVDRRAAAILEESPVIDRLIKIDGKRWHRTHRETAARGANASSESPGGTYDLAIDFQGLIKSSLLARLSGAPRRVGFETSELREKPSRLFLTEQIATANCDHVIDKNLALARGALGCDQPQSNTGNRSRYSFPIRVSPQDEAYAAEAAAGFRGRFTIINPGGGWPTKLWPASNYREIARILWEENALASFVTYGPGEEPLARTIAEPSEPYVKLLPSTLKQFVALARRAQLFIGGDTGPLHLAAAAGTPIVGIYGPTSPARNGPFSPDDLTVGRDLWCRPDCHRRSCWHWECMDIPVATVASAVRRRLSAVSIQTPGAR
jgi:lipopolysaccharide heptosyltransferase I